MASDAGPLTRADLREELDRLRDEMRTYYATKADLAAVEMRLTRWMLGLMLSASALAAAIAGIIVQVAGG